MLKIWNGRGYGTRTEYRGNGSELKNTGSITSTRTCQESFVRTPTKGLRLRVRMFLRSKGVTGKFGTDELRDGSMGVSLILPYQSLRDVK